MNASFRLSALALALASVSSQAAEPASDQLPSGGQVQAGQANISQLGHQLTVTQFSDRSVIDWQSFDVGSDAQVHFDQPSVSSATLNRVLSSNPTQVMGRITAPGQVFLVNPNGVLFGPNSQVDVGGLAASTLDIDNTDFMAGDLRFHSGAGSGSITSQGEIETTLGGFVALLAPEVINEGLIVAPYGRVAMAAGERVEIDLDGQGRWIQVEPALVDTLIENRHAIEVNAGQILLSSRAVNELARGVILQSGTLTANSMVQSGGRILLEGDDIHLSSNGQIQANGALGGGDVLIGGDWQGGQNAERRVFEDPNTLHQADTVRMEAGASIQANATDNGNGGTVVLWSDIRKSGGSTRAYGEIQAQGGPNGGDGGQVETSGAYLDVAGISVSTLATAGASGLWLLDPADIQLTSDGTDSIPGPNGPEFASSISASTVRTALATNDVEIYTGAAKNGTASITMAASVKWNFDSSSNPDGNSLTIRAHNDLTINGSIGNFGALTLIAQNITIGESSENNSLSTDGSDKDIILKATNDIVISDSRMFSTNGGDLLLWSDSDNLGAGRIELNNGLNVSTGGGDFIVGGGADGDKNDRPDGSAISSGSTANPGVQIGDASSTITVNTNGGDIWIRGQRNNSATAAAGISFGPYVNMQSGTGEIDIQGSSNNGYGIDLGTHNLSASDFIIRSNKTSGTAIRLVGAQTNTGASSYQAIRSGMSGSEQPFLIAGAGGNIIVQGTNSTSSVTAALSLGNLNVLGTGGTISIDGGTQAVEFGSGSRLGTDDGGKVIATSASDVTIRSDRLDASAVGIDVRNLSLLSASDSFTTLSLPTGSLSVTDYTIGSPTNTLALTLSASLGTGSSDIDGDISIYAGDLTINSGVTITAQSNKDIVLASTGDFINNSGSGLLTVSGSGRWLVFAGDAAGNTYGSLNSNNQAVWGEDASTFNASEIAGNRYVFAGVTGQTVDDLTVTTTDASKVYGTVADLSNAYSITGGNVAGQPGVYLASTATNYELSDLYSTNPTISSTKAPATEGVGTAPITISGGVALSGLTITQVSNGELTVTPMPLTLTATANSKEYDGNATATGTIAHNGVNNDEISIGFSSASFSQSAVGKSLTVTFNGPSLSGRDQANYQLPGGLVTATANINQRTLTLDGLAVQDKVYDGNDSATVSGYGTLSNIINSEDVELVISESATATFDSSSAGQRTATIKGLQLTGADTANYTIGNPTATANILQLALTPVWTPSDKVYDGNDSATVSGAITPLGSDEVTLSFDKAFADANAGNGQTINLTNIQLGGKNGSNYSVVPTQTTTANITPKALTATAAVAGKTYDGNDNASVTLSLAGLVSGEDLGQTVTASFDSVNAGTRTATIDSFHLDDGDTGLESNYTLASGDITFTANTATIATRAITLTATDVSQVYGDSDATLSVTASANGLASTDTLAEVTGTLTRESGSDVGNYDVALGSGTKASNYAITFATDNDAYEITPKALTATATVAGKTYDGNDDASVTLSLTGLVTGEDLGQTVTASFDSVNAGSRTATIDSFQLDDGTNGLGSNYSLAAGDITFTANTATIATRAVTLTAADVSQVYGDSDATLSVTASANGLASTDTLAEVTGTLTRESGSDVGNYDVALGAGTKASNYAITFDTDNNAYEITPKALTATATVAGKTYDGNDDASVTLSLAGLVTGEDLGQTVTASFDSVNAGSRTATIDSFQLDDGTNGLESNYSLAAGDITFTANTATIATRAITLTAADVSQVYGDSDATLSVTASANGLASTDTLAEVTGTLTRESGSDVGNYDVALGSGTKASNYAITFATDNDAYEITPKALTATATVAGKTYDGNDDASVTLSLAGLVTGEDLGQTVTASFDSVNAGSRTATIDSFQLDDGTNGLESNYSLAAGDITFTANTATIATRAITLTAADVSQVYGDSDATLSVTASANGLASTDTLAEVTGTLTRQSGSDVGNYDVALGAGTKASNYAITFDTDNNAYEITPLALTLSGFAVADKTYDSTTAATVSSYGTFTNLVGADVVSIDSSSVSAVFDNAKVGTRTATVTGIALSGADAGNYSIADQTDSASITAFTLDLGLTASDKVYDGSDAATVTASPNGFSGDDVSVTFNAAFSNENVANNKVISLSSLSLAGTDAGNYALPSTPSVTADIMPKPLTLTYTANNRVYDGTTDATVSFTDDRISGDTLTVSETAAFADKNVGNGKTVSITGVTLGGTDAANYNLVAPTNPTANITARDLTLTYTGHNRVYDGTTDATVSVTDDRITDDVLSITQTAAFADKDVGSGKAISLSGVSVTGTDAGNYNVLTPTNPTADITARSLTVTADASDKVYDGNNAASVTYSDNRVSGDVLTVSGSAAFDNKHVGSGKSVTVSGISLAGADAANYSVNTSASDTANISARTLTLTLTGDNRVYDGTTDATVSVADDRVAGDNIALDYSAAFSDKNVGNGKTISVTGISLLGSDASNYSVASSDSATGNITPRALNFTVAAQNKVYDQSSTAQVNITDDRISGDDLSASFTASFSDDQAGANKAVAINGFALNGADAANYSFTAPTSTTASITQRVLVLTVAAQDKVYDGTQSATVTVTDDRLSSDTLSYTYNAQFADKNVGTGKAVQLAGLALTGADASNYQLPTNATGSASITARTLNITANPINRVYDGTRAVNVSYSDDRISGDDFSISATALMTDKLAGANKSVALSNLLLSGTDAGNYAATIASLGLVDIDRRTLTVSADAKDKNYDATRIALVDLTDDRISGDQLSLAYSALFDNAQAGTNKLVDLLSLNLSGGDAANYRLGSLPLGLRADIVNQQANNLVFAPVKESDADQTAGLDVDKEILQIDQGLTGVALPEPPKVDTGPISVEVIAEPDVEFNGMVVVTMDLKKVETARFALPSSIRQLKPVGVQASAELRGGAPLPEWLSFNPDTMEFEALGNGQLDAPMQVDLVFGQYRLSVLVLPEELEAL